MVKNRMCRALRGQGGPLSQTVIQMGGLNEPRAASFARNSQICNQGLSGCALGKWAPQNGALVSLLGSRKSFRILLQPVPEIRLPWVTQTKPFETSKEAPSH